jgi:hypothetical protein
MMPDRRQHASVSFQLGTMAMATNTRFTTFNLNTCAAAAGRDFGFARIICLIRLRKNQGS